MKRIISILQKSGMSMILLLLIVVVYFVSSSIFTCDNMDMTRFEERVSRTLSQTAGAGKVSVVIRTVKQAQPSSAISGYRVTDEIPSGAIVVAQGGDNPLVRLKLTNALCALLGLHANQVEVIGMNEEGVE